jgi:ferredoxin
MCVHVCPDVFEIVDSVSLVRQGASQLFESHDGQIRGAVQGCPMEAIILVESD